MFESRPPLGGRQIERKRRLDRIVDPVTGYELAAEESVEVALTPDQSVEEVESHVRTLLACNHVHHVGGHVAKCQKCSEKAGQPVFVCGECSFTCRATGQVLCKRCGVLGPDGNHWSAEGLNQAEKRGLFAHNQTFPPCVPSRGVTQGHRSFIQRIFELW